MACHSPALIPAGMRKTPDTSTAPRGGVDTGDPITTQSNPKLSDRMHNMISVYIFGLPFYGSFPVKKKCFMSPAASVEPTTVSPYQSDSAVIGGNLCFLNLNSASFLPQMRATKGLLILPCIHGRMSGHLLSTCLIYNTLSMN